MVAKEGRFVRSTDKALKRVERASLKKRLTIWSQVFSQRIVRRERGLLRMCACLRSCVGAEEIVMSKDAAARLEKDIERRLEADRRRRIREARELEQQRLENEKKKEEAMRRRANGEELGRRQLSKKEKEALRKPKKGVRQAKTGPRRKKFDGEGSALEKSKSGKSKKKS